MKAALVVHRINWDINTNMDTIKAAILKAADEGAELVLFSEAALTGLINNDNPAHDLPLGQAIPGAATESFGNLCKATGIWLAIGLLELEGTRLYDTAVLIGPEGNIRLKYRRISPGWHGKEADLSVYCHGSELLKVETPFGGIAFLICGDLFDDSIVARVHKINPDWILFPFARTFSNKTNMQEQWDNDEKAQYAARAKLTGSTVLMANYLAEKEFAGGAFGGAMVVDSEGFVIDSFPLETSGILFVTL